MLRNGLVSSDVPIGGRETVRLPHCLATSDQGMQTVARHVEHPGEVVFERELDRADHVVLVHELEPGVEAEHRRHHRQVQQPGERGLDLGPDHVGEPHQGHVDVRVVLGEVADVALDRLQAAFERCPRRPGARGVLAEPHRVLRGTAVDHRGGLHDHVAHRRRRRRRRGEQVHRADHVDLVHRPPRHLCRVDHQEGVDDRVDLGGPHDPRQDGVVRVDPHVLGAFQLDGGLGRVQPDDDLDVGVGLECLRHATTPERAEAGHEHATGARLRVRGRVHPNHTERRRRSIS